VQAEDLVLNERSEWQEVEQIGKVFPHGGAAILTKALVVEAVAGNEISGGNTDDREDLWFGFKLL
jgi:hypothetical protein